MEWLLRAQEESSVRLAAGYAIVRKAPHTTMPSSSRTNQNTRVDSFTAGSGGFENEKRGNGLKEWWYKSSKFGSSDDLMNT